MHPLLSVAPHYDTPTALVFDLDPGAPAGILDAARIALLLRDMLRGVGLESWAKSSGSAGVQVYAPLNSPATFAETKAFARRAAGVLAGRLPDRVVATADRAARRGRVLVDLAERPPQVDRRRLLSAGQTVMSHGVGAADVGRARDGR
jgi:bifunctional non-homologous end joining protein LigD